MTAGDRTTLQLAKMGVRFIAINNSIDNDNPDSTEFACIHTEVGEQNREIRDQNKLIDQLEERLTRLNARTLNADTSLSSTNIDRLIPRCTAGRLIARRSIAKPGRKRWST